MFTYFQHAGSFVKSAAYDLAVYKPASRLLDTEGKIILQFFPADLKTFHGRTHNDHLVYRLTLVGFHW